MEKSRKKCEKCGKPLDKVGEETVEYTKRGILHLVDCGYCGHTNLLWKEKN